MPNDQTSYPFYWVRDFVCFCRYLFTGISGKLDGYHIRRSYGICGTGYWCNADYSFIINIWRSNTVYCFKSGLVREP